MLSKGINKIYKEDFENQEHYIKNICTEVRAKELPILFEMKAFYVPNNDYMLDYFGYEIANPMYDCYTHNGECIWAHHLVIPITSVSGKVVGFTGYNPYVALAKKKENKTKVEEEISKMPRYKESSVRLMDKSRFFLCPLGFEKSMRDGYIIVTDGVFDTISLANEGFNSFCILGSTVSEYVKFCLSFIDVVYVAYDNDTAGIKLYKTLKSTFPKTLAIRQSKCKDIDGFIKTYPIEFNECMQSIFGKVKTSITLYA